MRRSVASIAHNAPIRFGPRPVFQSRATVVSRHLSSEDEIKFPAPRFRVQIFNVPKSGNSEEFAESLKGLNLPSPAQVELKRSRKGKLTGQASLHYDSEEEASAAVDLLQGKEFEGKTLNVKLHAPPTVDLGDTDFLSEIKARLMLSDPEPADDPVFQSLITADQHLTAEEFEELPIKMRTTGIDPREKKRLKTLKKMKDPILQKLEQEAIEHNLSLPNRGDVFVQVDSVKREVDVEEMKYADLKRRPLEPVDTEFDEKGRPDVRIEGDDDDAVADNQPWQANIIAMDRTAKVLKGGIMNSFRSLVTIGNGNGVGGFGIGKASDPATATERALREAKRNIVIVDRYKKTALVHDLEGRHNSCKVVLRAVPPGYGMKAGRICEATLHSMGISDCTAKTHGRRKPLAVVQALFKALARHASLNDLARGRGRRIVELESRKASNMNLKGRL